MKKDEIRYKGTKTVLMTVFKNLARFEKNFVRPSNCVELLNIGDNIAKSFNIPAVWVYNYFDEPNKITFSDLYLDKFLDTSVKSSFCIKSLKSDDYNNNNDNDN